MGKKKSASRALTQEEIWDDSALVQSWDEAVEEYKLYHSIHARGENLEDVLREAAEAEAAEGNGHGRTPDEGDDEMADVSVGVDADTEPVTAPVEAEVPAEHTTTSEQPCKAAEASTPRLAPASMPNPILSQVQDEGLKNLMMAWYYAGYYTGLYEGQQQAQQGNNRNS